MKEFQTIGLIEAWVSGGLMHDELYEDILFLSSLLTILPAQCCLPLYAALAPSAKVLKSACWTWGNRLYRHV